MRSASSGEEPYGATRNPHDEWPSGDSENQDRMNFVDSRGSSGSPRVRAHPTAAPGPACLTRGPSEPALNPFPFSQLAQGP